VSTPTKVISGGIEYTREELRKMDEVSLRGLLHERVHHGIEVPIYSMMQNWKGRQVASFGQHAQIIFDVWRERGLPEDDTSIAWTKRYLALAEQIRAGKRPQLDEPLPTPFSEQEMAVVRKLLWERRSARGGWLDRPVPEDMIEQILAVIVVICYDNRPSHVVGQDRPESVPQNRGFDCAAACDHMLLMVHALGLSGVWLSSTARTAKQFKERYGLPDHIEVAMHLAFGWPIIGTIKSARIPLEYMMIRQHT
jgi:hypothetical protein